MKDYLEKRREELKKRGDKGFTLMEMLIVVAIIAVLIAIAIPVFTSQLENSRDATTVANLRSAYAEAQSSYLTGIASNGNVTVNTDATSKKVKSIDVKNVVAQGQQDGLGTGADNLPFDASSLTAMGNTPGTYTVTFTYSDSDGSISGVTCAAAATS